MAEKPYIYNTKANKCILFFGDKKFQLKSFNVHVDNDVNDVLSTIPLMNDSD